MKKKQEERFQNNSSYRNMLTQTMGPKGWFWDEAQPSSVYSHCLQAFRHSPLPHVQVPITLLRHDTKKQLQTQAAITGRTKTTSPDLQSTGNSKVGKGLNRLFFRDLLLPRHPGYECSSFCWIITVESMGLWFILCQLVFNRYIRFWFCPIFSACLEKTTGYIFPYSNFCCSPFCWKQLVTSKDKNKVWKTCRGAVLWIWKT